jgi:hypothetical protein
MLQLRLLAVTAAVVVAAALPVAASSQPAPHDQVAFKSDYMPLEK